MGQVNGRPQGIFNRALTPCRAGRNAGVHTKAGLGLFWYATLEVGLESGQLYWHLRYSKQDLIRWASDHRQAGTAKARYCLNLLVYVFCGKY